MPAETEEVVETIPEKAPEPPRTTFSNSLKKITGDGSNGVEEHKAEVFKAEVVKEGPDTSHIPEELLTKPEVKVEAVGADGKKLSFTASLKLKNEELERAVAERDVIIAGHKAAPGANEQTTAELKAEREARAALEQRLERADFTQGPRFRQFETREADQIAGAKAAIDGLKVEDAPVDPQVIEIAARLTGAKRLTVLRDAGLDAEAIAAVTPYLAALDTIGREKKAALDNYKIESETWKAQERVTQEQSEKQRAAEEERIFADVSKNLHEKIRELKKIEGQPLWNAQADAIIVRAKQIFNGQLPMPELAEVAHRAAAQEVTDKMNDSLMAKVKSLTDQVKKLTAAQPGAGDARTGANGNAEAPRPGSIWNNAKAAADARG